MADNIVGGLFGVDPQQIAQQRQATDFSNAYRYAQLDPLQQAKMSIYQGAAGLTRNVTGLLGGDPEMEKMSQIKQLSSQFNLTTPQGLRDFAVALQPIAPKEAMMAAAEADKREQTGLGLQKTRTDVAKAELTAANEEKLRAELAGLGPNPSEQQVIAVVQKYGSPDKILQILTASKDRAEARAARMAMAGGAGGGKPLSSALQKVEDTDLEKRDNYISQSNALQPSIQNLSLNDKGTRALELSPYKIARYVSLNAQGKSTPESRKYAALKSAVDSAVNLQVSAEKGVQTDKDVLRFADALIGAYGKFDTEATLEALKNYNNAVLKAKNNVEKRIQSRRKEQKASPYEFVDETEQASSAPAASVTGKKTVKFSDL